MYELGSIERLQVKRKAPQGFYLNRLSGSEERDILLPKKEGQGLDIGDVVDVFIYKDSEDRLITTVRRPKIILGQIKKLEVVETTKIGAFLDWGLEKDLFLPFSEQTIRVREDQMVLVSLYIDKSKRLCATMNIRPFLRADSPYKENDLVRATIYNLNRDYGAFLAVDDKYEGRIAPEDLKGAHEIGEELEVRVSNVKKDGKLDLTTRKRAYMEIDSDSKMILDVLDEENGFLPLNDKSSPEKIRNYFGMSKASFKRALGRLLKKRKIRFVKGGIEKING